MSKKRILFLDDRSKRLHSALKRWGDQVVLVTTVEETMRFLAEDWDEIYLDHDLNYEMFVDSNREDCGMEVVRFLVRNSPYMSHLMRGDVLFICHSSNRPAGEKMAVALLNEGYRAKYERWEYSDEQ